MAYSNFKLRLLFSFFFISIYLIVSFIDFSLIFYLILIVYLIILFEIIYYFKRFKFILITYLIISFLFFYFINFDNLNYLNFNFYIFIVIVFDIFSYIFGKLLGKNRFIKISPNKTLEGLFGGAFMSLILSIFAAYILNIRINYLLISFISLIIFTAFIGDIIESFFKRKNNLKNSSELMPGHGGIFDRFDSFLFSIIFYSISINI